MNAQTIERFVFFRLINFNARGYADNQFNNLGICCETCYYILKP